MLEDMKVSQLVKLVSALNDSAQQPQMCFWNVGKAYFIRTVTMHLVGELIAFNDKELLLRNASWVADSGRFHDALKTGELNEVEPFINDVILNRDCIVDATEWLFQLPKVQK